MRLRDRLNRLERSIGPEAEPISIFFVRAERVGNLTHAAALGFTATTRDGRTITVKAKLGETDEELEARTLEEVAPFRVKGEIMFFSELEVGSNLSAAGSSYPQPEVGRQ